MPDVVVVAGSVAQRPARGGHAWVFLQYLIGFKRLGYEVLFVDRLAPEMVEPEDWPPGADNPRVSWLDGVMGEHGLGQSYTLLVEGTSKTFGLSREAVAERVARSVLVLDVMGFMAEEELLAPAPRRAFLDLDPGFPQMWQDLGLHDSFGGHDAYVTVGLRVGKEGSRVPTCGIDWIPTPQPVVLDQWPATPGGRSYTSVASWRGPFEPIDYQGERFGLRAHQMRAFASLPGQVEVPFELALDIDPADAADADLLRAGGWSLSAPDKAAGTVDAYRRYVQGSRGEIGVAKDMYVRSRGGWLSDRSLCYLASGKPVLAQATGFELEVETGEGLIAFGTPEEAAAGVEEIERDYPRHAEAARQLAVGRFDSDRVLADLLEAVT